MKVVNAEGMDIINISDYGEALRNSGYKDIESAMAEIVDNSIQAEAKNVLVIIKDRVPSWGRRSQVYEVAFFDDGTGMSPEWVQGCLRFGNGTRRTSKGMGKFGVGLPQSSLYACPRVEVYSWQDGVENTYSAFLDIEKISNGEQVKIEPAEKTSIPDEYLKYVKSGLKLCDAEFDFSQHGTLVLWRCCDNVVPSTVSALFKRLGFSFGKKYRHLICENQSNIFLIHDTKDQYNEKVMPNDPLFLMNNNIVLGDPANPDKLCRKSNEAGLEPIFEPYCTEFCPDGVVTQTIKYWDRESKTAKEGKVKLTFSIVKEKFYDMDHMTNPNPGNTPMGTFVGQLEGISVVREGREIDFGEFGFYSDKNSPFHRWWGCEISFERDLDQVFKVANNKQHVELIKLDGSDYEEEEFKPVWLQLEKIITDKISEMQKRNKELRKGSRTNTSTTTPAEETATKAEEGSDVPTESGEIRKTKTEEELKKAAEEILQERGNESPQEEETKQLLLQKVVIQEEDVSKYTSDLFMLSVDTGICICTINTGSLYYDRYVTGMGDEAKLAFELLLASFVRTIDEAAPEKRPSYKKLMSEWNFKLNKYLSEFLGLDN